MNTDDIVRRVAMEVPDAPSATIKDMLTWAMADLCHEGNAWVHSDGPVVVAADTDYAELESPADSEPVRVLEVLVDDRPLKAGIHYRQTGPSTIRLSFKPQENSLHGSLAVKPLPGKEMPEALTSLHHETLRHGTLHKLLMLPQPWKNPEQAIYHRQHWEAGVTRAKQLAAYGNQAGGARVRPRRFL